MHTRKKHSQNTYAAASRRMHRNHRKQKRRRRFYRLCTRYVLGTSVFTFVLFAACEWNIVKPQSGSGTHPAVAVQPSENTKKQQIYDSGTDNQTEFSGNTENKKLFSESEDNELLFSESEDTELLFSADADSQIPSVPERQPAEQLFDTTLDDGTEHVAQVSGDWNLILVNPWNELPKDYEPNLTMLPNGHSIDSRCYPALTEMMNACRDEGLTPLICSSYRSQEKQEALFQERIDELRRQGYSKKAAQAKAATSVARPGTSEHQIGLAVDIVDRSYQALDARQEYTPVQQWLMANSWKYGFILRYPKDKGRLTGIIYEPWHYRYVGVEAADEIYERGICLEEYLGGE